MAPEQFEQLITKAEFNERFNELEEVVSEVKSDVKLLNEKVAVLSLHALSTDERLGRLEEKSDIIIETLNDMHSMIDGLTVEHKNQRLEFTSNIAAHDRFEARITKLEQRPAAA